MARKSITVTLDDKALNRQIQRAMARNPQETTRAVRECLLDLAGESSRRAPVESGDLRSNCHAALNGSTVFENKQAVATAAAPTLTAIGRVGYSLPYALRQHEDLTLRHDRTDGYRIPAENARTGQPNKTAGQTVNLVAGGEAKFLERPFEERKARYIKRLQQVPERSLKK